MLLQVNFCERNIHFLWSRESYHAFFFFIENYEENNEYIVNTMVAKSFWDWGIGIKLADTLQFFSFTSLENYSFFMEFF